MPSETSLSKGCQKHNKRLSVLLLLYTLLFPKVSRRGLLKWVRPSVCTYARYIPRLAFVLVSVYSIILGLKIGKNWCCGVKNGVMGLKK